MIASLEGREYTELRDSNPDGLLKMRVLVCSFFTVCFMGIFHIRVHGHRHPLRTASSDTVILTVRPSYMLTSASLQIDTYPALAKISPLSRDWSARLGTMSTVRAGSLTGWYSFETLDPGVLFTVATVNILGDGWSVGMNGSLYIPGLEVHAVSYAAEGMEPSRNPFLSCPSVSFKGDAAVVAVQAMSGTTTGGAMGISVGPGGLWGRAGRYGQARTDNKIWWRDICI